MGVVSTAVGQIISRQNVERAVLQTLQTWLNIYLVEVEQQNGLAGLSLPRPPAPDSYYGGVDSLAWIEDRLPVLIVTAEPVGDAERLGTGDYNQDFEVAVTAVVSGTAEGETLEDSARAIADHYGAAVMTALVQRLSRDHPTLVDRCRMVEFPRTIFPDEDVRTIAQSVQSLHVYVTAVVNDLKSAQSPVLGGNEYIVENTNFDLEVVADAGRVPAPSEPA